MVAASGECFKIKIHQSSFKDLLKINFRDRTLSMYEGGPEDFCGGHEIF